MKSATYSAPWCNKCLQIEYPDSGQKIRRYASHEVLKWERERVECSILVHALAGHCTGCAQVYHERARVLGNLLWKLGVRVYVDDRHRV